MTIQLPSQSDWLNIAQSNLRSSIKIVVNGVQVEPQFVMGNFVMTLSQLLAYLADALCRYIEQVDASLRLASATGSDLDDIGAEQGNPRKPGTYAQKPIKLHRNGDTSSTLNIPTGLKFTCFDAAGNPTLLYDLVQGTSSVAGVAATYPVGAADVWAVGQCEVVGLSGNVSANDVAQLATNYPGIDLVSDPPVQPVGLAPTTTVVGTPGTNTESYMVVARGVTGFALPSTQSTQLTTAASPKSNANYTAVVWNTVPDATQYDIVMVTTSAGTTQYWYCGTAVAAVTATQEFDVQADPTVAYQLPLANTSNAGIGGTDKESDADYRARIPTTIQIAATSTATAIQGAVQALAGVQAAYPSDTTPGSGQVLVKTTAGALTAAQSALIASTIAATKALGANIGSSVVTPTLLDITYTYAQDATGANTVNHQAAVTRYLNSLAPGQTVRNSQVQNAILNSDIHTTSVTVNSMTIRGGATYNNPNDVPAAAGVLFTSGIFTASVGV